MLKKYFNKLEHVQATKRDPNFSILKLIVEKILELLRLELKTPTSKTCASEIKIVFVGKVIDKFIVEGKYILKFCPLQKV